MNRKEKLIERLRLEVVCPAKSRMVQKNKSHFITLLTTSRYFDHNEGSLSDWLDLFEKEKLNLYTELEKLVKREIGQEFSIEEESFSGYLGVGSHTSMVLVKKKGK